MTYEEYQKKHQSIIELQDKIDDQAVTIQMLQHKLEQMTLKYEEMALTSYDI